MDPVLLLSGSKSSSRLKQTLATGTLAVEKVIPLDWFAQSPGPSEEKVMVKLVLWSRYLLCLGC